MSTFSCVIGADESEYDISALRCTSDTWKKIPEVVEDNITDCVESMYVNDQQKYDLARRAQMCADQVNEKEMDEVESALEDYAYARLWYENEVRDTEKIIYENKGKTTDNAFEATMVTRQQLEDERYQNYLRKANEYNSLIDEKQDLIKAMTASYWWTYNKEIIDDRDKDRRFIAEEWITQREIDDGLWDPQGYAEDKDEPEEDKDESIHHPLDDDGPAVGSGCLGCAEHQPNQEAHMGPGGCLNMPSDTESDDGSKYSCTENDQDEDCYPSDDDEPWWVSMYEDRLDR